MASSARNASSFATKNQTNSTSSPPEPRQQTISHLFSSTREKKNLQQLSPSSKRKRTSSSQLDSPTASPALSATSCNMYNFSTKSNGGGGDVIDFSSAASGSPRSKQKRMSIGAKIENAPSVGGPKKLAVKNFRTAAKADSNEYVNKTVSELEAALSAIFGNQRPALSNEELYRGAENVCRMGHAPQLAKMVAAKCKAHVTQDLKSSLLKIVDGKDIEVLRAILDIWVVWTGQLVRLSHTISSE